MSSNRLGQKVAPFVSPVRDLPAGNFFDLTGGAMIIRRQRKPNRYTLIPNSVIEDERLSLKELGLLVYLLSKPDNWQVSPSHLCKARNIGRNSVYTYLRNLKQAGYADWRRLSSGDSEWVISDEPDPKNWYEAEPDPKNPHPKKPDLAFRTQVNTDHITNTDNKRGNGRFAPPSVSQVREYCRERGNTVDAESFVDFYEAKGWYVGKNKMKDWKAAIRTWERRESKKSESDPVTAGAL